MKKSLTFLVIFLAALTASKPRFSTATKFVGYSAEKTCFSVTTRGETSPYKITSLFVLPNEEITLNIEPLNGTAGFDVAGDASAWTALSPVKWTWKAPAKTGMIKARVTETVSGEFMDLQIFVMVPYGKLKGGALNGYKIGSYPKVPAKENYSLPRGFIEVTPENKHLLVSPHFTLGQFLCKQDSAPGKKYVVLREKLILKLEYILEHVNAEGIPAKTFSVMSGYRTPFYNKVLGNVKMSRHMWGDAADIYINDDPGVIGMEDLNGDGKSDAKDAQVLYRAVEDLNAEPAFRKFMGGLGWYKPTKSHGPFVHVDARGTSARWSSN